MLRQVSLQVKVENGLQAAATARGVKLNILDCKTFNKTGMTVLTELRGEESAVKEAMAAIRRTPGVRQAVEGEKTDDAVPMLVVLDRPSICRASNDAAIVCLECPLNSETQPATWRFITRRASDFRQVMAKLSQEGIEARIEDVAPLERKATLTGRQKEIVATAISQGYFEFPRKISLTKLSELVGVKPSTLSEVLRSAERRIMANALGTPFQDE